MKTKYYRVEPKGEFQKQTAYVKVKDENKKYSKSLNHDGYKSKYLTSSAVDKGIEITKEEFEKHYKPKPKKEYITKEEFSNYHEAVKELTTLVKNEFENINNRITELENKPKDENHNGSLDSIRNEIFKYEWGKPSEVLKEVKENLGYDKGCKSVSFKALGLINKKTGEVIKFEEEEKSGWRTWEGTKYLMYHDFEKDIKFGFDALGNWNERLGLGNGKGYPIATDEEILKRLTEEAKRRGFDVGYSSGKYRYFIKEKDFYFDSEKNNLYVRQKGAAFNLIMNNGKWAEVVEPYEPKKGDVVKAWYHDNSNFVFGIITNISDAYEINNQTLYNNVEPAPEEVVKHFKN